MNDENSFSTEIHEHCSSVIEKLNIQRCSGEFCDVMVVVQRMRFWAHKSMLAATSHKLYELLSTVKPQCRELHLDEVSPQGFKIILDFIYSSNGLLWVPIDCLADVSAAAEFLEMSKISEVCSTFIMTDNFPNKFQLYDIECPAKEQSNLLTATNGYKYRKTSTAGGFTLVSSPSECQILDGMQEANSSYLNDSHDKHGIAEQTEGSYEAFSTSSYPMGKCVSYPSNTIYQYDGAGSDLFRTSVKSNGLPIPGLHTQDQLMYSVDTTYQAVNQYGQPASQCLMPSQRQSLLNEDPFPLTNMVGNASFTTGNIQVNNLPVLDAEEKTNVEKNNSAKSVFLATTNTAQNCQDALKSASPINVTQYVSPGQHRGRNASKKRIHAPGNLSENTNTSLRVKNTIGKTQRVKTSNDHYTHKVISINGNSITDVSDDSLEHSRNFFTEQRPAARMPPKKAGYRGGLMTVGDCRNPMSASVLKQLGGNATSIDSVLEQHDLDDLSSKTTDECNLVQVQTSEHSHAFMLPEVQGINTDVSHYFEKLDEASLSVGQGLCSRSSVAQGLCSRSSTGYNNELSIVMDGHRPLTSQIDHVKHPKKFLSRQQHFLKRHVTSDNVDEMVSEFGLYMENSKASATSQQDHLNLLQVHTANDSCTAGNREFSSCPAPSINPLNTDFQPEVFCEGSRYFYTDNPVCKTLSDSSSVSNMKYLPTPIKTGVAEYLYIEECVKSMRNMDGNCVQEVLKSLNRPTNANFTTSAPCYTTSTNPSILEFHRYTSTNSLGFGKADRLSDYAQTQGHNKIQSTDVLENGEQSIVSSQQNETANPYHGIDMNTSLLTILGPVQSGELLTENMQSMGKMTNLGFSDCSNYTQDPSYLRKTSHDIAITGLLKNDCNLLKKRGKSADLSPTDCFADLVNCPQVIGLGEVNEHSLPEFTGIACDDETDNAYNLDIDFSELPGEGSEVKIYENLKHRNVIPPNSTTKRKLSFTNSKNPDQLEQFNKLESATPNQKPDSDHTTSCDDSDSSLAVKEIPRIKKKFLKGKKDGLPQHLTGLPLPIPKYGIATTSVENTEGRSGNKCNEEIPKPFKKRLRMGLGIHLDKEQQKDAAAFEPEPRVLKRNRKVKYICELCGREFWDSATRYAEHMQAHKDWEKGQATGKMTLHFCADCGAGYSRQEDLSKHRTQAHPQYKFQCTNCSQCFINPRKFKKHCLQEHGIKLPFVCGFNDCSYQTYAFHLLEKHCMTHCGESLLKCPTCNNTFTQASSLRSHMLSCMNIQLYPCTNCNKTFNRMQALREHCIAIHAKSRPYVCTTCSSAFANARNLQRHMLIHTNKLPYSCRECDRKFRHSNALKRHLQKIHAQKIEIGIKGSKNNDNVLVSNYTKSDNECSE